MLNISNIEISLRGEAWVLVIMLTSQRFIEAHVTKTGQVSFHALYGYRFA